MNDDTPSWNKPHRGRTAGPFILTVKGVWGSGRHSDGPRLDEVGITDLSVDTETVTTADQETVFVYEEDVEPAEGLDVILGTQTITHTRSPDHWQVRDA